MKQKYLNDGRCVAVQGKLEGSDTYAVAEIFEFDGFDEDGYEHTSERLAPTVLVKGDCLFDAPPRQKWDEKIKQLEEKSVALDIEINARRSVLHEIEHQEKQVKARLKDIPSLEHVLEFIDGKITHYVVVCEYSNNIQIIKFDEALSDERYRSKRRLLSLFGDSEGNLSWGLNQYKDGSGRNDIVFPARSEEEAIQILKGHIVFDLSRPDERIIRTAEKYEVPVPEEYRNALRENRRVELYKQLQQAEGALLVIRKRIEAEGLG